MSLYFLDFNDWEIFNYKYNFFLPFLFDLNNVRMPDNTETFDDFISLGGKILKYLSEYVCNLVSLHFLKSLIKFRKVQYDFIVKLFAFFKDKNFCKKILLG